MTLNAMKNKPYSYHHFPEKKPEMGQSCEEEVLVWVFPNHESKTSDLEKPILALPIHRIDIPEKLKKWHQEVEKVASGG